MCLLCQAHRSTNPESCLFEFTQDQITVLSHGKDLSGQLVLPASPRLGQEWGFQAPPGTTRVFLP